MALNTKGGAPVIGLDVGAAYIKVVELRPGSKGLTVTGVGIMPTPPGCIENDEIIDPGVLATAVKQLLTESGIKTKSVVASVAGQSSVVVRVIEVPRMSDKELAETMRWEIDRHIPFAPDEVVKDYSVVIRPDEDVTSANMAILLAVAQNAVVSGQMQIILECGLTPHAIDVETLASARSILDISDAYNAETVALVNIGASKTDIGIYEYGTLVLPRVIPMGGNALTQAIAAKLGITNEEAERMKLQFGEVPADAATATAAPEDTFSFADFGATEAPEPAPGGFVNTADGPVFDTAAGLADDKTYTPTFGTGGPVFDDTPPVPNVDLQPETPAEPFQPESVVPTFEPEPFSAPEPSILTPSVLSESDQQKRDISDAFLPILRDLAEEIKRSMEYYVTRASKSVQVDRILVFGGCANLPGLLPYLESQVNVPVYPVGIPPGVVASATGVSEQYLNEVAPMLPVVIGLASRDCIAVAGPVAKGRAR